MRETVAAAAPAVWWPARPMVPHRPTAHTADCRERKDEAEQVRDVRWRCMGIGRGALEEDVERVCKDKTASRIASHFQKFCERQKKPPERKRKSIHGISRHNYIVVEQEQIR